MWVCRLETNECTKTNEENFTVNRNIFILTHVVADTEIPLLPNQYKQIEDILKIGKYGEYHEHIYDYYVLFTDGTIWRWYGVVGNSLDSEFHNIPLWIGGISWVIFLDIIAVVILISFNRKQIEKSV